MTTSLLAVGSALLNVALQTTLMAALILVLLVFFRGRAVWRYHLAYSGLIALALLALTSPWLQQRDSAPIDLQASIPIVASTATANTGPDQVLNEQSVDSGFEQERVPETSVEQMLQGILSFMAVADPQATGSSLIASMLRGSAAIWLAGVGIALLRMGVAALRLRHLILQTSRPTRIQEAHLQKLAARSASVGTEVEFMLSTSIRSPVHVGFLRPAIILPADVIKSGSDSQLQSVIAHELAHWQRRDNLANLVQGMIVAMFWFHPFIHALDRIASRSREEICDNYVLAQQDPLSYSETLLWLSSKKQNAESGQIPFAVAMFSKQWRLEQRIQELIDENRETTMTLSKTWQYTMRFCLLASALMIASLVIVPSINEVQAQSTADAQIDDREQRSPPQANDRETLSTEVFDAVSEIQELMVQRPDEESAHLEDAKRLLDQLYEEKFETANSFEKSTILNFYTNYYLRMEDYPETARIFEQLLDIDGLREDTELRTLRSLGQLYQAMERWTDSIEAFQQWRELSGSEDAIVFRGLAYGHYQLELFERSREFWQQYLELKAEDEVTRDDLAYLNGLHFRLEDYESALALTQEMILQFNTEQDWANLRALYEMLDDQDALAELDPELGGTLNFSSPEPQIAFASVVPTDGDYLPLLATAPMYPRVAADEGIEGWVLLEFTVNASGAVDENSITVVDAEPAEVFNVTSIRAARDFVFSPRRVAGESVPVPGVQYLFRFRLEDDDA